MNAWIENVNHVMNVYTVHNVIVVVTEIVDVSTIHVRLVFVEDDAVNRHEIISKYVEMVAIVEMYRVVRISVIIVVDPKLIQQTIVVVTIIVVKEMIEIVVVVMINVHMRELTMHNDRIIVTDHGVNVNVMRPDVIHVNVTESDMLRLNRDAIIHSDAPTMHNRHHPAWTNIAIKFVMMSGRIFGMASLGPTEMINIHRNDHFQNENETQTMKTMNGAVAEKWKKLTIILWTHQPTKMLKKKYRISV